MEQKIEGGWEERFEEKYCSFKLTKFCNKQDHDRLKDFISDLLASERQRCVEAWDKAEKHGTLPQPNPFGRWVSIPSHNRVIKEMGQILKRYLEQLK